MKGGHEAEAAERTKWANKDRLKIESSIYYLRELKEKAEAKRRAAQAEAGEVCDEEEMSQSDDNEVIPLNQVGSIYFLFVNIRSTFSNNF